MTGVTGESPCIEESNENMDPGTLYTRKRLMQLQSRSCDTATVSHCLSDCTRTEEINEALAKLIVMNQLPLSFCSSFGFQNFMHVLEPNYKICWEQAIKRRLTVLNTTVEGIIKGNPKAAKSIACTTDCWSSLTQDT